MTQPRRFASATGVVLAIAVLASCALGFVSAGRAQASTAYRYWAFYVAQGSSWIYSSRGPVAEHPADGEVQGWRFAVQVDKNGELTPRVTPNFKQLCGSTPAVSGKLRVGIVLDFGTAADAPANEKPPAQIVTGCVQVDAGSSGADVLQGAVGASQLRIGNTGLLCGIDGYPKTECAPAVAISRTTATPTAPTPTPTNKPAGTTKSAPSATASAARAPTTASAGSAKSLTTQPETAPPSSVGPVAAAPATSSASDVRTTASLAALRTKSSTSHGFPIAAVAGGVLVVVLGVAAFVKARR